MHALIEEHPGPYFPSNNSSREQYQGWYSFKMSGMIILLITYISKTSLKLQFYL